MAYSPSQRWVNGVLVERNIESNRWTVNPDGTLVEDVEPVENKVVKKRSTKTK